MTLSLPSSVVGVDFSGAADAGRKIWLTLAIPRRGTLAVEGCMPIRHIPGVGENRASAHRALVHIIESSPDTIFGLDFPFSLPAILLMTETWEDFVLSFDRAFPSGEQFRDACRDEAGGRELRRLTDQETRTPFAPYNLRLYRQTYYGIRDVLAPLARNGRACVLPMQAARPHLPWVIEICPACLLKRENLYQTYKGSKRDHRRYREGILDHLSRCGLRLRADMRQGILDDTEADALDSVLAAFSAWRNLDHPRLFAPARAVDWLEGRVYV